MVWIEIPSGDGLINDAKIERIYNETPRRHKDMFRFYAEVNGKIWLIYSQNLPKKITEKILATAKQNPKYGADYFETGQAIDDAFQEVYSEICDMEDLIFSKLMGALFDAQTNNNNQVINFGEKLHPSESSE